MFIISSWFIVAHRFHQSIRVIGLALDVPPRLLLKGMEELDRVWLIRGTLLE